MGTGSWVTVTHTEEFSSNFPVSWTRYAWWQLLAWCCSSLIGLLSSSGWIHSDSQLWSRQCALLLCSVARPSERKSFFAFRKATCYPGGTVVTVWSYLSSKKHALLICKKFVKNFTQESHLGWHIFAWKCNLTNYGCGRQTSADSSCNIYTQNTYQKGVQIHKSHSAYRLASLHGGLRGWLTLHLSLSYRKVRERDIYIWHKLSAMLTRWDQHWWNKALNRRNHKFKDT